MELQYPMGCPDSVTPHGAGVCPDGRQVGARGMVGGLAMAKSHDRLDGITIYLQSTGVPRGSSKSEGPQIARRIEKSGESQGWFT